MTFSIGEWSLRDGYDNKLSEGGAISTDAGRIDWKNYFLEHLAQLCVKAYPPETTHAGRSQLHNPMASRSDGSLAK